MEADYFQAAIPDPVAILGQRLKPYSLGHEKILRRYNNPYVTGGEKTLDDLLFGAFICSMDFFEAIDAIHNGLEIPNGFWRSLFRLPPKRISIQAFYKIWLSQLLNADIPSDSDAFDKYILDASRYPRLHESEGGRLPGASFVQRVEIVLRSKLGCSREEALNMPWGEAVWNYFAYWELEDRCKIISKDDEEEIAQAKAALDALEEKQNAKS